MSFESLNKLKKSLLMDNFFCLWLQMEMLQIGFL